MEAAATNRDGETGELEETVTVVDQKKFAGEECGRRFRLKFDLTRHDLTLHQNVRESCPSCEAVLNSMGSLRRHLMNVHGVPMSTRLQQRKPEPSREELERGLPCRQEMPEGRYPNIPPLMSLPLPTRVNRVRVEPEKTQRVLVPIPRVSASATVTAQNVEPSPPH